MLHRQAPLRRLARGIFVNRDFALLWWGQAISSIGDYAWDTALVLWIATTLARRGQSWAPLAVSGVILAAAIPQIAAGPIAGVFVDRWDARRTMLGSAGLQAVAAVTLLAPTGAVALPVIGRPQLPVVWQLAFTYADVALIAICAQFFQPAQLALIKDVVPREKEDYALQTSQAIQGLAIIVGPPLAAALVFGLGLGWALLLNAASFVVVCVAIFAIAAPAIPRSATACTEPRQRHRFGREFAAGLRYVWIHRVLRTILISEALTWLGFGALQTLGYFFITENLHAPPGAYGVLGADFGAGSIIGAVLVTLIGHRVGLGRLLWIVLVASGMFVTVMSHLTSLGPALVAAFLFGVSATAILVTAGPLALRATRREFVGRVTAVINPAGRLAALLSIVTAGLLVSTVLRGIHLSVLGIAFGPVDTVLTGTGLLAIAGGLYARKNLRGAGAQFDDDASRL